MLELLCDELEPRVKHFECVDHPDRLNRPDRSVNPTLQVEDALGIRSDSTDVVCWSRNAAHALIHSKRLVDSHVCMRPPNGAAHTPAQG